MKTGQAPQPAPFLDRRRAGVLLHITSLPSGCLSDAVRFLDFLRDCGFSAWQVLPVGPGGPSRSPYSPSSAFAGNPDLLASGYDHEALGNAETEQFREDQKYWLDDFALFSALGKQQENRPWWEWPAGLRDRDPAALAVAMREHAAVIEHIMRRQALFDRAWRRLRREAAERDILLFGDMPMFVIADSADVWSRPDLFRLDGNGRPTHVAGVPPDGFTAEGQCWDNPVYDWEALAGEGFDWWLRRLQHETGRFDLLRWDHFRGLVANWEIPVSHAGEAPGPADGAWHAVPGRDLLRCLQERSGPLHIVAENLGIITTEVEDLRHGFGLPGMHVLQFAFDGNEQNPHLPAQHEINGVAYTGTHDNDTALGWFHGLDTEQQSEVLVKLGAAGQEMPEALVHAALDSRCRLAVIPMQDLLGLGSAARMNVPGQAQGQWRWRFDWDQLSSELTARCTEAVRRTGRQAA